MKSAYEPSGPSGRRLSVSTPPLPPGLDASPLQGYPQRKFAGTHLFTWEEPERHTPLI